MFEELHGALMSLRCRECLEGAEILPPPRPRIYLPRVETVLTGFELADHALASQTVCQAQRQAQRHRELDRNSLRFAAAMPVLSSPADRFSCGFLIRTLGYMSLRLVIPGRGEVDGELPVERPWWRFSVRFNVALSQSIPVARMHQRECEGVMMRWGLALESPRGGIDLTRRGLVRSDAVQFDQDLRNAWLNRQRGIVPVAGFFLWQRAPAGHHQPHYVRLVNRAVFGLAALWERAETPDGEVMESCALMTVDANPLLAEIDNVSAQMPAILRREDYGAWLASNVSEAMALLQPYPQIRMVCHPVGPQVNYAEFDEPGLIRPARPLNTKRGRA